MKTKILSVLLACLMVVSVLPVAVFADTKCTLAGDAVHTLKNCPDATEIRVVPVACGTWGYTVYKCPECSEYFADDFVEGTPHTWEVTTPAVPANCTEGGLTAVETCTNCGVTRGGEPTRKDPRAHVYEDVAGNCVVQGFRRCVKCGHVKNDTTTNKGHKWNTIPEIVKKPSCEMVDGKIVYTDGVAKYTCSVCNDTKEVTIIAAHMKEAMTHVAAKAPTCTEDGNVEYWVCTGCGDEDVACGATFIEVNGELVEAPKDANGEYDIVIDATGHDFTNQDPHADPAPVAPTCTTNGSEVRTCNTCGEDITIVLPATGHNADPNGPPHDIVEATCDQFGYMIWICLDCGEYATVKVLPKTGHKMPTTGVVPADCVTDGSYVCEVCNQAQVIPATGHNVKTETVKSNCVTFRYTYTHCLNDNCPLPLVESCVVNGVEYDVTLPDDPLNIRIPVHLIGEPVVDLDSTLNTDPAHIKDQDSDIFREPTCTEKGWTVYYCRYCREYEYEQNVRATGHKMVVDDSVYPNGIKLPTCTEEGYIAMICDNGCGHTEQANKKPALGHAWGSDVVVLPTCQTQGYTLQTCSRCGEVQTINVTDYVPAVHYTTHVEDGVNCIYVSHPNATEVEIYLVGTCTERGLYRYHCPDCNEYLLVVQEGTGMHIVDTTKPYLDPTCTDDGFFTCARCGEYQVVKALGHDMTGAPATCTDPQLCGVCQAVVAPALGHDYEKVAALKETCTTDGHNAYQKCTRCGDEKGKVVYPKLNHKNIAVAYEREVSCELFGFTHYLCPDCKGDANGDYIFGDKDAEYIVGYRNALDHDWVLNENESYGITCEANGLNVYYCAHGAACRKDDGTDEGAAWGKKTEVVVNENPGHKNAAGETIVDDCRDTVEDRVCVNPYCPDADKIIGLSHDFLPPIRVDATCINYAYDLLVCKNCEHSEVDNDSIEKEYGKHSWGDEIDDNDNWVIVVPPTFTTPGKAELKCTYGCGQVHTKEVYKTGIEFTLDMDNAVVSGAGYADSSLVAVKINMNSHKVDVWGVRVNLKYDPTIVKYEGYEIVSNTFTVNQAAHDNGEYVTLVANTANTEDKKAQDLPVEGTETFAIVYFRIDNKDAAKATFGFVNDETNDKICEAVKADGTVVDTNVDNTPEDNAAIATYDEAITIKKFMDANEDGDVTMEDALALYNAVKTSKYNVVIDTDKDGEVTLADLMNLYNYLVGSMSYKDVADLRA